MMLNWARNLQYSTQTMHAPRSVDEVCEIVAQAKRVKALGTRHSFNAIADTDQQFISLHHLNRIVSLDTASDTPTVTVEGGITYGQLCGELNARGFALHNLASLPHISVAGACATATHGSGTCNANLASAVGAMQIVGGRGEVIEVSKDVDGDRFNGTVVHLGALGVVTSLTLRVSPHFDVTQDVFENLPLDRLSRNIDAIASCGYSVSLFTDWRGDVINQVWIKRRAPESSGHDPIEDILHGAVRAIRPLHPIAHMPAENCTRQLGVPGAWFERLPHFRMDFTPSSGAELQSEYFVPREHARSAIDAIHSMRAQIAPLLQISEIRWIAADELWLSPCYCRDCVGIHFTWNPDWPRVKALLPSIEMKLSVFGAVPHWGKLFTMPPGQLQSRYARLDDFRHLRAQFDPHGKFRNDFLDRNIGPSDHAVLSRGQT